MAPSTGAARHASPPSVLVRLLDPEAGYWSIRPTGDFFAERRYIDDTMVLRTVFTMSTGRIALTDALTVDPTARGHQIGRQVPHLLVRRIEGLAGTVEVTVEFVPRPEYGLTIPLIERPDWGVAAHGGAVGLDLLVNGSRLDVGRGLATGTFTVQLGDIVEFALRCYRYAERGEHLPPLPVNAHATGR